MIPVEEAPFRNADLDVYRGACELETRYWGEITHQTRNKATNKPRIHAVVERFHIRAVKKSKRLDIHPSNHANANARCRLTDDITMTPW